MLLSASPTFVALPLGGLVDTNFGSGGIAIGPSAAPTEYVATQADGKIVVLSESLGVTQLYDVVTRFNADGTLDTTFGNGGSVVTSLRSDSGASLESSLAIQADGKIVVVGDNDAAYGPDHGAVLLRLNSDGSIDTSFGANGMVVTHFGDMLGQGLAVFAESDGKLLEIGHRDWTYSQGERVGGNVALALFNADGTLDTTFGSGGIVDCSGPADISVACAQLQPDGKILLGGSTSLGAALIRLNADGTLDQTFGVGGQVLYQSWPFDPNPGPPTAGSASPMYRIFVGQFSDIAVQGDGKIVALAENGSTGLIRLNSDGSIDTSFGQNGEIAAPATSYEFGGKDFLLVQSDGRIVVDWGAGLNRYNSDGSIEATFGDGGTDRLPIWGETVANAPDGSIIVLGVIGSWDTGYRAAVVRLVDFAGIFPQPPGDGGATPLIDASEAASFLPAVAAQYHLLQIGDATVANAGAAAGDLAITAVVTASNLDSSPSSQPAALTIDSPAGASSSSGLAGLDRQLAPASTGPAVLRLDGGSVDAALSDPLGGGADASKADDLLVLDNALTPPFARV